MARNRKGEHQVVFSDMDSQGNLSHVRSINQSDIAGCPHFIMVPEHYRTDGSCKCNDPEHQRMMIEKWGYSHKDFR